MSTSGTGEAAPAAKAKPAGVRADEAEHTVRELLQTNGALAAQNAMLTTKVAEQEQELEPARRFGPAYAEAIDKLNNLPNRFSLGEWIRLWWKRRDAMSGGHDDHGGHGGGHDAHGGGHAAPKKGGGDHGGGHGGGGGKLSASTIAIFALIALVLALAVGYAVRPSTPGAPTVPVVADPIPAPAVTPTPTPEADVAAAAPAPATVPLASNTALSEFLADCAAHNGTIYTADEWNKLGKEPFLPESGQLQCDY